MCASSFLFIIWSWSIITTYEHNIQHSHSHSQTGKEKKRHIQTHTCCIIRIFIINGFCSAWQSRFQDESLSIAIRFICNFYHTSSTYTQRSPESRETISSNKKAAHPKWRRRKKQINPTKTSQHSGILCDFMKERHEVKRNQMYVFFANEWMCARAQYRMNMDLPHCISSATSFVDAFALWFAVVVAEAVTKWIMKMYAIRFILGEWHIFFLG